MPHILENKRKQHSFSTAHKRRIRDEVKPQLRAVKGAWWHASHERNLRIKLKWHSQKLKVQGLQRDQKLLHKAKILAHKKGSAKSLPGDR